MFGQNMNWRSMIMMIVAFTVIGSVVGGVVNGIIQGKWDQILRILAILIIAAIGVLIAYGLNRLPPSWTAYIDKLIGRKRVNPNHIAKIASFTAERGVYSGNMMVVGQEQAVSAAVHEIAVGAANRDRRGPVTVLAKECMRGNGASRFNMGLYAAAYGLPVVQRMTPQGQPIVDQYGRPVQDIDEPAIERGIFTFDGSQGPVAFANLLLGNNDRLSRHLDIDRGQPESVIVIENALSVLIQPSDADLQSRMSSADYVGMVNDFLRDGLIGVQTASGVVGRSAAAASVVVLEINVLSDIGDLLTTANGDQRKIDAAIRKALTKAGVADSTLALIKGCIALAPLTEELKAEIICAQMIEDAERSYSAQVIGGNEEDFLAFLDRALDAWESLSVKGGYAAFHQWLKTKSEKGFATAVSDHRAWIQRQQPPGVPATTQPYAPPLYVRLGWDEEKECIRVIRVTG